MCAILFLEMIFQGLLLPVGLALILKCASARNFARKTRDNGATACNSPVGGL
jgi:hypothetical protein